MPIKKTALPPRTPPIRRDFEDEIRRLKNDLFVTRQALVDLLDTQDLLSGYFGCKDFDQIDKWRLERASAVIEAAWVRPGAEMGDPRWPRAICPLCRQGAQGTRDVQGYAVPEGLRRHLLGELNSRQCAVFAAAEQIARDGAVRHRGW
ncbi:hypothetical protein AWB69_06248 [Caballeronia udeis]|uniref:Uncharacterized protein n=1 Tax=Caballeronia udeis TaxID=1232866 RepID=A0A158IMT7_9BURK|nr:hypothetical protein [Caballeronia udeis]SAL57549.1 hypothetical protein AWB69_06248 [Caballeronia udeis]